MSALNKFGADVSPIQKKLNYLALLQAMWYSIQNKTCEPGELGWENYTSPDSP